MNCKVHRNVSLPYRKSLNNWTVYYIARLSSLIKAKKKKKNCPFSREGNFRLHSTLSNYSSLRCYTKTLVLAGTLREKTFRSSLL